jgi:hypothetical protein
MDFNLKLSAAVMGGNYDQYRNIIKESKSTNKKLNLDSKVMDSNFPLAQLAIANIDLEKPNGFNKIFEHLIDNGANPEIKNHHGENLYQFVEDKHPEKLEYLRKYLGDDNLSLTTQESFSSLDSDMSFGSVSPKRPTKERPSFSSPRTQKIRASSLNNSEDVSIGSFTPSPPTSAKRANISPKGNSR